MAMDKCCAVKSVARSPAIRKAVYGWLPDIPYSLNVQARTDIMCISKRRRS